jgi:hypothetical protein
MHKLGVKETLFAGLGLQNLDLERVDTLLVHGLVVETGRAARPTTQSETSRDGQHCQQNP